MDNFLNEGYQNWYTKWCTTCLGSLLRIFNFLFYEAILICVIFGYYYFLNVFLIIYV
jgi:hypothetical protein